LQAFFNSVNLFEFRRDLRKLGVPSSIADYLFEANHSIPSEVKIPDHSGVENMWARGTDPELNQEYFYTQVSGEGEA
jgi:hypothetical protein